MPIPDFQSIMLPLLDAVADGQEHRIRDVTAKLADVYSLSEEERLQRIPSGLQGVFTNRVAWPQVYLKKAELMIEHGIGVTTTRTYALKKIDSDYFVEDGP